MIEYGNLEAKQEWFSVPMRNRVRVVAKRNRIGLVALLLSLTTSIQLLAQQPRVDTIVKNAGAPLRAGLGQLVYDGVTIGHLEGAPEYTFTRVAGIELGRDASIYVFDVPMFQGTRLIRQYDANGKYLRSIGRTGDGPGEFRRPEGVLGLPDGRFLIVDGLLGRINVYSSTGQSSGTWPGRYRLAPGARGTMTVNPAGIIAIRHTISEPGRDQPVRQLITRLRLDGTVLETVQPPALDDLGPPLVIKASEPEPGRRGGTRLTTSLPYYPKGTWAWSPLGYFVTARTDRYALDFLQPGKPVLRITRTVPAVPVTSEERLEQKTFVQRQLDAWPGTQTGTLGDVPAVKPQFSYVAFDANGRIFVSVATQSERFTPRTLRLSDGEVWPQIGWRSPLHVDVFEPDGVYVGQFAVPYGVNPIVFRGDRLWAVIKDDLDVEYIKRYRIVWR